MSESTNNIGFCFLSSVPLRFEPSDRAEMVDQFLFADTFDLLEVREKWTFVRSHYDEYEGWIDNKQYKVLNDSQYKEVEGWQAKGNCGGSIQIDGVYVPVPVGARYPVGRLGTFAFCGMKITAMQVDSDDSLLATAFSFLRTPYLWGGKTFGGIDCSGFVQVVFRAHGIHLLRDASQQVGQGSAVHNLEEALPCDLCFFSNDSGKVIHVGIYVGDNRIIHASGMVRVDTLVPDGIYNSETNLRTHTLCAIRRMSQNG